MILAIHLSNVAAEHLGKLHDLLRRRLGLRSLAVKSVHDRLDVLNARVAPVQGDAEMVADKITSIERESFGDLLNLVVGSEVHERLDELAQR